MFPFKLEPEIALLTVTRTGKWSLDTVSSYEAILRQQLLELHKSGASTSFIIDIRPSGPQAPDVAHALTAMVQRLGSLHADRTAVVTSSGIAKLQARRLTDRNAQVFTSMVLARDWVIGSAASKRSLGSVHDEASQAEAEGCAVHIHGPSDVDVTLTPQVALETAKRISDAAAEALLGNADVPSVEKAA